MLSVPWSRVELKTRFERMGGIQVVENVAAAQFTP